MFQKEAKLRYKLGLHARPASILVQEAEKYDSQIIVIKDNKEANLKSILGLLWLKIAYGEEIIIRAEGNDERKAVEKIVELLEEDLEEIVSIEFGDNLSSKNGKIEDELKEEIYQRANDYNTNPGELLIKIREGIAKIKKQYWDDVD